MNEKQDAQTAEKPKVKKRGCLFRICRVLVVLFLALVTLIYFVYLLPFWGIPFNKSRHGRVPITPPWALECWLWEDDVNNAAFVKELLEGYAKHDFPVRTILIDSPWSWRYNDFKVDEDRYPEPEKFFHGLQDQGYRVVLWMTCMVDSYSKDTKAAESKDFYDEAHTNGFLAAGAQMKWWKGKGGFIDYSNPKAMKWWHGLQQQVLDWGVDGWKLDGCDTFFSGRVGKLPVPFNRTYSGWMTTRQYMDHFARGEYQHGLTQNSEFVTLIRALDQPWSHPEGFAPLDAAPVTWVGDNRHTWNYKDRGIEGAISDILGSARLGYCVIGSDVAGYHGRSNPDDVGPATAALLSNWKPKTVAPTPASTEFGTAADKDEIAPNIYIRWAEFSTFCGLFLNGGHGERRMWKRTQPELEIVRKFSWLHTELVPYTYSHVVACHNGGPPLMRPMADGKFQYLFGDDFLVAPIHEDKLTRTVSLPTGGWRYLFDDRELLQGPQQLTRDYPLDEFPVFVRDGAVVPLKVTRAYTGFGDKESEGFTTWLVYPNGKSEFTLWNPETHPKLESTTVKVDSGGSLKIEFSGKHAPHILRILSKTKPVSITLDGQNLPEGDAWKFEPGTRKIIIKTRDYAHGTYLITRP
ncbi:MAG: glycoside hydrolase family 31 protein [Verrucomicrobia bacterium]|nr:glycoside hydrolase family 31 protein [Verrucomicrobiota bacterium]